MSVAALLDEMVSALTDAGIPFMLTGSFAAAAHGAGRATMDVDFVIDPDARARCVRAAHGGRGSLRLPGGGA